MRNIHHLTLGDRQTIETEIGRGSTKAAIGRLIGKDPCGIGRENQAPQGVSHTQPL
jgi:IS30 family transposase